MNKSNKKHLDYEQLITMYSLISSGCGYKEVCAKLNCSRQTLYRIITQHCTIKKGNYITYSKRYRNCMYLERCKKNGVNRCSFECKNYKQYRCPKVISFPYMCNFCPDIDKCNKDKYIFDPNKTYNDRTTLFSESKKSPRISRSKLSKFDDWFSPLVKTGSSIETICSVYKEHVPVSSRTIRNWVDQEQLSCKRIDLRNAVTRRYNVKEYTYKHNVSGNPLNKYGRMYQDFRKYILQHPEAAVFQLDTVHGKKTDKKYVLTIHDP